MGTRKTAGTCAGLAVMLCSLAAARTVAASTIVVTSTSEFDPGSLRSAIASATPGDTIEMRVRGTIGLTAVAEAMAVRRQRSATAEAGHYGTHRKFFASSVLPVPV